MDGVRTADSRGQMILMGALVLAVLFVGLALVLNSAIYTENLSTRDVGGSAETLSEDHPTEERLSESLAEANYHSETANYEDRMAIVEDNVSVWNRIQSEQHARAGRISSTSVISGFEGTRVTQSTVDEFMPASDDLSEELTGDYLDPFGATERTSWIVAPDVQSRAFEATAERSSLRTVDGDFDLENLVNFILDGNDPFGVAFDEGEEYHTVYLLEIDNEGAENEVAAVTTEGDGTDEEVTAVCRIESETVTLRLGANELVGEETTESCPEFEFTSSLDRHDLYYVGAHNIEGTYRFITDKDEQTFHEDLDEEYDEDLLDLLGCLTGCDTEALRDNPDDGEPYTVPSVYGVSVELTYQDDRVTHTRTVTIAPETK